MPVAGVQAGYRQTLGNPGGPGVNTVRTILELFDSPSAARAGVSMTVKGYQAAGYTQVLDPSSLGLGPDAMARLGSNVQTAPQFAQGTVKQGLVFVWRSGNLLLIQIDGGDSGVALEAAAKWVASVNTNAKSRGS